MRRAAAALVALILALPAAAQERRGELSFGAAYSSRYGAVADATFDATGLFGGTVDAAASLRRGDEGGGLRLRVQRRFDLGATALGDDTVLRLGLSGSRSDWDADAYASRSVGLSAGVTARVSPVLSVAIEGFARRDEISDVDPGLSPIVAADLGESDAIGARLSLRYDDRDGDGILAPGRTIAATLAASGLGGARDWRRATLDYAQTRPLGATGVSLRARASAGRIVAGGGARAHVLDRAFTAAGLPRGFAWGGAGPRDLVTDDPLGGQTYASASLEALTKIGDNGPVLGLFYDVGSIWSLPGPAAGRYDDSRRMRDSVGISLGLETGAGLLSLSVAEPLTTRRGDALQTLSVSLSAQF
ncbi:MAG: BamA/TamA family outer membrane protein [Paracoccaceae bacterium]